MKMKHELIALCMRNNLYMPEIFEEYDSEAWIKFIEQFDGIDLSRVDHLPNWSVYIRLWGYWRSMNRDLLKKWFDWNTHTTPIFEVSAGAGDKADNQSTVSNIDAFEAKHNGDNLTDEIELKNARGIFWEALEQLKTEITDKQYKMINWKYQGVKNKEIVQRLNINNKILNEQLLVVKNKLSKIIVDVAKSKGMETSYEDLLESLA
jgi:hypothetical protein